MILHDGIDSENLTIAELEKALEIGRRNLHAYGANVGIFNQGYGDKITYLENLYKEIQHRKSEGK